MSWIENAIQKELNSGGAEIPRLNRVLRLVAKHRSMLLQNELVKNCGVEVLNGPFKGMKFIENSAEGCHMPKLLGCYESELHGFIAAMAKRQYQTILNIGCAEGYYAVGFKRLFPATRIIARDTDTKAQNACVELAQRNGVQIETGGLFQPEDFAAFAGRTLVWCDIEGGEKDLLDPLKAPSLAHTDIVVELHPGPAMPNAAEVPERFRNTHDIRIVKQQMARPELPPLFQNASHLDQLLAVWEWRSSPTPWAIMIAREFPSPA